MRPELTTIRDVPIVSTGTYALAGNPYPGGETTFTEEDLADAVAAVDDPAVSLPRLKLGHASDWGDAEPSFGKLDNLRLGDSGQTIYADYVGVPKWLATIMPSAYPSRSIEAGFNVTTQGTGKEYRMVISALALLGVMLPGVATLADLPNMFTAEVPDGVTIEENEVVINASGGDMKLRRNARGSVNVDDVRRAYYDQLEGAQGLWWIRAVYLDPNELIVDDDDGTLYRVPFTPNGDTIDFAEAQEVKMTFVTARSRDKRDDDRAPLEAATHVFASRAESRPENNTKEDQMDRVALISKLGLPEDASDDDILAAIPSGDKPAEEAAKENASVQPPGQSEGNPADQGPETGTPSPNQTPEEQAQPSSPAEPEAVTAGLKTVDASTLAELQRDAAAGRVAREEQVKDRRESKVDTAIKAGKFPPARRAHWLTLMASDEDGTTATIDTLESGLIPVAEAGSAPADDQLATASYPAEWLSPAEQARAKGAPTIQTEV